MRILIRALILGVLLPAWVCAQNSSDDALKGKTVDQWVALLGSDKFSEREEASTVLANGGERAVSALKKAAASGDNEVRLRARLALSGAIPVSSEGEFSRISAQSFLRGGRPTPQGNESGESTLSIEKGRLVFWQSYGSGVTQVYSFPEDTPLIFREKCTIELTWESIDNKTNYNPDRGEAKLECVNTEDGLRLTLSAVDTAKTSFKMVFVPKAEAEKARTQAGKDGSDRR